ncbi:MAG: hypothetical protein U0Z70_15720 [Thermomicrobiales bacterium]|nr:hypothetical protein [Chloroflexia bacterium]
MDLLKEFFGATDDDVAATQAAPTGETTGRTEEERQQARDAKREARRAERQARKADPATEAKRAEFAERYKTGHPSEGFSAEEAIEHLQELQKQLTPAEFRKAMEETLNNLPVDQRDDFIALMREQKAKQASSAAAAQDPFGGLLGSLMGGQGAAQAPNLGDVLNDLRQGGLNAPAPASGKQLTEQDFMQLINSPLGKAVLGGLATYGMQQLQQQDVERKAQRAKKPTKGESS